MPTVPPGHNDNTLPPPDPHQNPSIFDSSTYQQQSSNRTVIAILVLALLLVVAVLAFVLGKNGAPGQFFSSEDQYGNATETVIVEGEIVEIVDGEDPGGIENLGGPGAPGPAGAPGANGSIGSDGNDGSDGAPGQSGAAGRPGNDGTDGDNATTTATSRTTITSTRTTTRTTSTRTRTSESSTSSATSTTPSSSSTTTPPPSEPTYYDDLGELGVNYPDQVVCAQGLFVVGFSCGPEEESVRMPFWDALRQAAAENPDRQMPRSLDVTSPDLGSFVCTVRHDDKRGWDCRGPAISDGTGMQMWFSAPGCGGHLELTLSDPDWATNRCLV